MYEDRLLSALNVFKLVKKSEKNLDDTKSTNETPTIHTSSGNYNG